MKVSFSPPQAREDVVIQLTAEEADLLWTILGRLAGGNGTIDLLYSQLEGRDRKRDDRVPYESMTVKK